MTPFPPIRPRRRPQRPVAPPSDHRETFPLRTKRGRQSHDDPLPPHLRLQQTQPFARPMSGLDHHDLGMVYGDISNWRTRLKAINAEIADAQRASYNDIADGARIKGWLMVGKGLRFLPGIELIDGGSKEDIRWDELQHQGSAGNRTVYWILVAFLFVLLAAGLSAVAGLLLATSPGMAVYLPFFRSLQTWNKIPSGIATVLIPTIAATIFITAVVLVIRRKSRYLALLWLPGHQDICLYSLLSDVRHRQIQRSHLSIGVSINSIQDDVHFASCHGRSVAHGNWSGVVCCQRFPERRRG